MSDSLRTADRAAGKAPAFNGRFEPPTIGGFPLYTVIGIGGAIISGSLAVLMPWLAVRVVLAGIAIFGVLIGVYYLRLGDKVPFQRVMFEAWREKSLYTHEYRADE